MITTATSNRAQKIQAGRALVAGPRRLPESASYLDVQLHGVAFRMGFSTPEHRAALARWIPVEWLRVDSTATDTSRPLEILWMSPADVDMDDASWDDDPDPELAIVRESETEIAVQRDFLGVRFSRDRAAVVCCSDFLDGFHNAMRWFLPWHLLHSSTLVLHASSVVARNQGSTEIAHLFLGPSGAGKTTVASLSHPRTVLGDDMILLRAGRDGFAVEASALGQNPRYLGPLGRAFRLGGVYLLKQAPATRLSEISPARGVRGLLASLLLPEWIGLADRSRELDLIFNLTSRLAEEVPIYELAFDLSGDLWRHIDEFRIQSAQ